MYGPFFKNKEQKNVNYPDKTFEEYKSFFSNLCAAYGDQLFESHSFKIILNEVKEGNYHLLDYKDLSELTLKSTGENNPELSISYSSEQISECLKDYIEHLSETENSTNLVIDAKVYNDLWYKLSYLYKPKEEYKLKLRDNYVITEFGKYIQKSARDGGEIKDVSKLPFPRESILGSLIREWKVAENQEEKDILERGGYYLAFYQEGVGVEDLHMIGMDTDKYMKEIGMDMVKDMKELEKIPKEEREGKGMLFAKKLDSDEVKENKKKWEHFNKLCEKDITIIQGMIVGTITKTHVGDTPIDDLIKDLPDDDKSSD
jgi:hypothetical protein